MTKKICFFSNLSLNCVSDCALDSFYDKILRLNREVDIFCISGVAEPQSLLYYLKEIKRRITKPIVYSLGEGDLAHDAISPMSDRVRQFAHSRNDFHFLFNQGIEIGNIYFHNCFAFPKVKSCYNRIYELNNSSYSDYYRIAGCLENLDRNIKAIKEHKTVLLSNYSPFKVECCHFVQDLGTWISKNLNDVLILSNGNCKDTFLKGIKIAFTNGLDEKVFLLE